MHLETRLDCDVPIRCLSQGQSFEGRIVDISGRGVRLLLSQPVERRSEVALTRPSEDDAVRAEVVWVRKVTRPDCIEAGMIYQSGEAPTGSWLADVFRGLSEGSERKLLRLGVDARGSVHDADEPDAAPIDCVVRNLGPGGCRFEAAHEWPETTRLLLTIGPMSRLAALVLTGRIMHGAATTTPGRWLLGMEFEAKLDAAQEELLESYLMFLAPIQ